MANNNLRIKYNSDHTQIWCNVRKRFIAVQREGLEEEVRQRTIIDLVSHYKYPLKFLDVNVIVRIRQDEKPRSADIVVFRNETKQEPFIVVENKQPEKGSGTDQAEKYAKILGAEYAKYTDGISEETLRISYVQSRSPEVLPVSDIPLYGKAITYSITSLIPFPDLKSVLQSCHDDLRRVGKDPVESFKIMSKLVVAKIFDERNTPSNDYYEMQYGINETDEEVAGRVRSLFFRSIETLTSRNDGEVIEDRTIEVDDTTIASIVKKLQRYSFIGTAVDTKGTVFETFIDAAFRGPFGQYFTPRTVVSFMVEIVYPKQSDVVIDPACGSGGFLIYVLNHVRRLIEENYKKRLSQAEIDRKVFEFAQDNIFGMDIASLPEFAAKVNMLVNDDGRGNIYSADALSPTNQLPQRITRRKYDIAITNPPFGVKVNNPAVLSEFDTGKDSEGTPKKSQDTKILFIERCLQLIKEGGKVMIVLPNGILNNPSEEYQKIRQFVRKNAIIRAVFRIRDDAFLHTGTGSRTSLVYLQKRKKEDSQGPIFMSWIKNIGYDKQGRTETKTGEPITNDFPVVLDTFRSWEETGRIEELKHPLIFTVKLEDLQDSLDPRFYNPALTLRIKKLKEKYKVVPLKELLVDLTERTLKEKLDANSANNDLLDEIDTKKVIKGKAPRDYQERGIKVVKIAEIKEINDLYQLDHHSCQFISDDDHAIRIQSKLYPQEILFAITGATIGKVTMVPEDIGEANICSDIAKVRVDKSKIDPYYVFAYLSSELGQLQIRSRISGSTNEHLACLAVEELEIPLLPAKIRNEIAAEYKSAMESLRKAREATRKGKKLVLYSLLEGEPEEIAEVLEKEKE